MLLSTNVCADILGAVITLILVAIAYIKYAHTYWNKYNIQHLEPKFPFGNMSNPFVAKQPLFMDLADNYKKLKAAGVNYAGIYHLTSPVFIPIDVEMVKNVLLRDFAHFVNHGVYYNEKDDPLSANLFALEDNKWKNLRQKLTPTFTGGKIKMMFETFMNCSAPFLETIDQMHANKETLDIKELIARFTTDIIGSCAFGIDCNSFKDPDAEFRRFGKKVFEAPFSLKIFFVVLFPKLAKKMGLTTINKDVSRFFLNVIKNTVECRENNNYRRKDFMQLLIDLKNNGDPNNHDGNSLTLNELSAQAYMFFLAGFETASTALTYCLFALSQNQDAQDKVRLNIEQILAKHNGQLTYENINEMKYVDQCINETLRMFPPVPMLNRVCTKDYNVPDSDVIVKEGTSVLISVYGIHHDSEYYPEPDTFNPDRFSEDNKRNLKQFTFLPFGEGPRVCVAQRFGMLQIKVGLVTVLRNYKLHLNPKTPSVLTMYAKSFFHASNETIYLDTEKIK